MSKPLELTVYPPLSRFTKQIVAWNLEQGYEAYRRISAEMHAPGLLAMHTKRLTEAELCAEYWAACTNCATIFPRPVHEWERADTLHRFATRPHYFEESA